jgi:hypothetical protein
MAFAIGTALTGLGLMTFPIVWITVGHEKFVEDLAGKAFSDWTVAWLAGSKAAICMASVFGGLRLVEAARHLTLPLEMHYQLESASIAHRQPPNERKVGERLGLATEQLAGVMMAPVKTVAHQVGGVAAAAMDGAKKQDTEGPNKLNPSS